MFKSSEAQRDRKMKTQDKGLTLNKKFEFAKKHIISISHMTSTKGMEPDTNKVKAIYSCQSQHGWRTRGASGACKLSGQVTATAGCCHRDTEALLKEKNK